MGHAAGTHQDDGSDDQDNAAVYLPLLVTRRELITFVTVRSACTLKTPTSSTLHPGDLLRLFFPSDMRQHGGK